MKKPVRIALVVVTWAVVTWLFRDRLLRIARPDQRPVPRIAAQHPTAPPVPATSATAAGSPSSGTVPGDDLTDIKGIGPVYSARLADAGIATFADLAEANAKQIADAIDAAESMIDDWIAQARNLGS